VVTVVKMVADTVLMDSKKKVTISWSGGKDSALALYKTQLSGEVEVVGLHTIINEGTRRVGMHGVREELIERQAQALNLPLTKIYLESSENHDAYEKLMRTFYGQCADEKLDGIVFGDIFLEDLKLFREKLLAHSSLQGIFPLWRLNTATILRDFIQRRFKTLICSANAAHFTAAEIGRTIDEEWTRNLPAQVDPCGENGEFHTFVYDGPIFETPVPFTYGEVVSKTYSFQKIDGDGHVEKLETTFWFQDLLSRMD
jgi:uncharacterized protein (TIGR00290 family)